MQIDLPWCMCCCCCCCVASVVSDSVLLHRRQPTSLHRYWDSPDENTGVGCHFLLPCMKMKSESEATQSCPTLSDPWTAAYQAPALLGFSRQEYWSGVPLPSPASLFRGFKTKEYQISSFFSRSFKHSIREGTGTPLQYSCPENLREGGAC